RARGLRPLVRRRARGARHRDRDRRRLRLRLGLRRRLRGQRVGTTNHAGARPLWATAFYAGLRRGELQALRVSDVDLGASLIRVEHGWDQYGGAIEPKSRAGRRTVPLLALLGDYLDEHLLRTGREGSQL